MSTAPLTGTCIVSPEALGPFRNGGVGTAAYRLAELLARHGHEVTLLYSGKVMQQDRSAWQARYYDEHGIRLVVLDEWDDPDAALADPIPGGIDAQRALRVHAFLRRQRFAVIYFQEFMGHSLRAVQAWRAGLDLDGARLVTWCHSSMLWSFLGNDRHVDQRDDLLIEAHERLATRLSDVVAAPSTYMAGWVDTHWGIGDVRQLPYWYDGGDRDRPRGPQRFEGFSHLVFFGRLERRKGLDLLLAALRASPPLRATLRRVTFLGRQIRIEGRTSQDHIAAALAGLGLDWDVVDHLGTDDALAWLEAQPGALVIAPSVLDNFPFVIMELFQRRIPFLSTRVGGIPEVIGPGNADQMLVEPTVAGVREGLLTVLTRQMLTIDYASGYDPDEAARAALAFHERLLREPPARDLAPAPAPVDVLVLQEGPPAPVIATIAALVEDGQLGTVAVLADPAASDGELASMFQALAAGASAGRWTNAGVVVSWPTSAGADDRPLLVLRAGERLVAAGLARLRTALHAGNYDGVCGYVLRTSGAGDRPACFEQRPLGAALELGFLEDSAITTPLLVRATVRPRLAEALHQGPAVGRILLQQLACGLDAERRRDGRERLGVVPCRVAEGEAPAPLSQRDRAHLARVHYACQPQLDDQLLFPMLLTRHLPTAAPAPVGCGIYPLLAKVPEERLAEHLAADAGGDTVRRIVAALAPRIAGWQARPPSLVIYGAGEHTKVLLALFPMIWPWVTGFIDGQRTAPLLGKPCRHPDRAALPAGTTVIYSSREHETAMYARLAALPLEHVRIYGEPAP